MIMNLIFWYSITAGTLGVLLRAWTAFEARTFVSEGVFILLFLRVRLKLVDQILLIYSFSSNRFICFGFDFLLNPFAVKKERQSIASSLVLGLAKLSTIFQEVLHKLLKSAPKTEDLEEKSTEVSTESFETWYSSVIKPQFEIDSNAEIAWAFNRTKKAIQSDVLPHCHSSLTCLKQCCLEIDRTDTSKAEHFLILTQ